MFKSFWSPFVGETLIVKQKGNKQDCFAIALIRQQSWPAITMIVSHIPREFSQYFTIASTLPLSLRSSATFQGSSPCVCGKYDCMI